MSWVAAAVVGSAVIGGVVSSNSADKAADAQNKSSQDAINAQNQQLAITRADQAPYRQAGEAGVNKLRDLMGIGVSSQGDWKTQLKKGYADVFARNPQMGTAALTTLNDIIDKSSSPEDKSAYGESPLDIASRMGVPRPENLGQILQLPMGAQAQGTQGQPQQEVRDFEGNVVQGGNRGEFGDSPLLRQFTVGDFYNDPVSQLSMKYGMDMGQRGINNMAGARGNINSGATLKALTRFGQDYAGSKAAESQQRFVGDQTNVYNRLAGISGTGQTAATQTGQMGMSGAQNIGNIMTAQGNARGAAAISQGNAQSQSANTVGNYFQQQQMLDKLTKQQSPQTPYFQYSGYDSGGGNAYG